MILEVHTWMQQEELWDIWKTQNFGILFSKTPKQADAVIDCYPDVDWSGVQVDRRSTASYIFKFLGAPIPWCSKKQSVM